MSNGKTDVGGTTFCPAMLGNAQSALWWQDEAPLIQVYEKNHQSRCIIDLQFADRS
jgi:hypothetical protein